jgi:pimeloyl-ACP methyl ester carboxylesterase
MTAALLAPTPAPRTPPITAAPTTRELIVLSADGTRLAVRDYHPAHADVTVILKHGWCLSRESWDRQRRYLIDQWGQRARVIDYDHRGHGRSDAATVATATPAQLADDLATVITALNVTTPLVLAGHSMGAMSVLEYMAREHRPVEPSGLVLVATAAHHVAEHGLGRMLATPATGALHHLVSHLPDHVLRRLAGPVCAAVGRSVHCGGDEQATLCTLAASAIARTPLSTAVGFLPGLRSYDAYRALRTITAHTVVVSGGLDLLTPAVHAHEMVAAIDGAEHIHLPHVGHMVLTEAATAVNDALGRVLQNCLRSNP